MPDNKTIFVTGATGNQGGAVVSKTHSAWVQGKESSHP